MPNVVAVNDGFRGRDSLEFPNETTKISVVGRPTATGSVVRGVMASEGNFRISRCRNAS